MIQKISESSLANSQVFNDIQKITKVDTKEKAIRLIKTAKHLSKEDIETAYISIRQINDVLTTQALKAYDDERIVLIYNDIPSLSVTQALPFITFNTKDGYKTYIFMDKYITVKRTDGTLNIRAPELRDLLISALIANAIKINGDRLYSNQYIQSILMDIYAKFVIRILNKEYSIATDKQLLDTIQYWINRFFLTHIFESSDSKENSETIAHKHFKYIDELKYQDIKNIYDESEPSNISELLELIKSQSSRMNRLDLGTFLSKWVDYYYLPSMLAIDNIEYLIFMVNTLLNGNNIISISASDIVKDTKHIRLLKEELLKVIE